MLEHYYDVNRAGQFEALFGPLAMGRNPTPLHNQYFVMKWDFSLVKAQGTLKEIETALYRHVNAAIEDCAVQYGWRDIDIVPDDAVVSLSSLLRRVRQEAQRLYLLIDEYDNFANEVLMTGRRQEFYEGLLYGEGVLKSLFKAVKGSTRGIDRVFMTGVSPVVLSDMTSGYNVGEDIDLHVHLRVHVAVRPLRFCASTLSNNVRQNDRAMRAVRSTSLPSRTGSFAQDLINLGLDQLYNLRLFDLKNRLSLWRGCETWGSFRLRYEPRKTPHSGESNRRKPSLNSHVPPLLGVRGGVD